MKTNPILITLSDPSSDADGVNEGIRMLMASADSWLRALAARRLRNPADIEDAVQDVYIRVYRSRQTYTGDTEEAARKWLGAIVANCSRDILKPKRVNDLERRKHLHMEFDSYEDAWARALEDQDAPKLPDYQRTHEVRGPSELQKRSARTARRRFRQSHCRRSAPLLELVRGAVWAQSQRLLGDGLQSVRLETQALCRPTVQVAMRLILGSGCADRGR